MILNIFEMIFLVRDQNMSAPLCEFESRNKDEEMASSEVHRTCWSYFSYFSMFHLVPVSIQACKFIYNERNYLESELIWS